MLRDPRLRVLGFWSLLLVVLAPLAARVEDTLDVSARILGSESALVEATLEKRFDSPFAHSAILVVEGVPGVGGSEGRRVLGEVVQSLSAAPGVRRTFSFLDTNDPYFVPRQGDGTFLIVGLDARDGRADRLVPRLRGLSAHLEADLRKDFPSAVLRWTGEAPINYDLWRTSTTEARTAEWRALPLTVTLLLFAFGSFVAALLPAVAGVLAVVLVLGAVALVGSRVPLSILIVNVTTMLGLALGIDYALLTLGRFRESLGMGLSVPEAARKAREHAGATVFLSGAAVLVGFASLLVVPLQELRSAALGGLLVVAASVLLSFSLVPALLAWLGRFIGPLRSSPGRRWRGWGRRLAHRPLLVLAGSLVPLVALALQARRLNPRIPGGDWLPPSMESAQGLKALQRMGRSGIVDSLRVVLELPEDVQALSGPGWEATRHLEASLAKDPRIDRTHSLQDLAADHSDDLAFVSLLPSSAKRTFLSQEADAALVEVVPKEGVDPGELSRFVRTLRGADARILTGLAGCHLRVGGLPAFNADYEDAVRGRFGEILLLVVAGTMLALFAGFRSILVPLKAVLLNLLSVFASFGALVLVFQDGWGCRLLGLPKAIDGVFPIVPVLVFATVFGLSMDYEVFLVARIAEARRGGLSESDALCEGLASTGGLITSAAAIMIAVFWAFTWGEFVLVKMLGFTLSVAVFLDATLIRIAAGPALLRLAGRFNWWPGGRSATPH